LSRPIALYRLAWHQTTFSFRGLRGPREWWSVLVLTVRIPGGPDLLWRTSPLSHESIPCQSEHDDYVYSRGGVIMSGGHISVLECLLSDAREHLWLCLILPSIKWFRYPMTPVLNYSECIDWYIQGHGHTWTLMVVLSEPVLENHWVWHPPRWLLGVTNLTMALHNYSECIDWHILTLLYQNVFTIHINLTPTLIIDLAKKLLYLRDYWRSLLASLAPQPLFLGTSNKLILGKWSHIAARVQYNNHWIKMTIIIFL
jgi:hypothetical protein